MSASAAEWKIEHIWLVQDCAVGEMSFGSTKQNVKVNRRTVEAGEDLWTKTFGQGDVRTKIQRQDVGVACLSLHPRHRRL